MPKTWTHLPTWLLLIGYPLFWTELLWLPGSHTTWIAPSFFLITSLLLLVSTYRTLLPRIQIPPSWWERQWFWLSGGILLISFIAAILPPHLMQEGDALNYHLAIPRQHLILGSFRHLPWSIADLWPFPVQFGLAPYWFCTPWPNKFPQYIFLLGLIGVSVSLAKRVNAASGTTWGVMAAILGSHGFGIQFGSAMLDITLAYLAVAALDSLWKGDAFLAAVEMCFYFWAKSFHPIQITLLLLGFLIVEGLRRKIGGRWTLGFSDAVLSTSIPWKKAVIFWVLLSVVIGGPFILKSLHETGTPLFPFGAFTLKGRLANNPEVLKGLKIAERSQLDTRLAYGTGRSLKDFMFHFWRIAVPDRGVNNAFDYPVGLPYLLCIGPFLGLFISAIRKRQLPVLPLVCVLLWGEWWMGSQQSRWLYVPLILMFISTLSVPVIIEHRVLRLGITLGLLTTGISVFRSHAPDLRGRPTWPLRPEDMAVWKHSRDLPRGQWLHVGTKEVAFSEAPVIVVYKEPTWVLPIPEGHHDL